jgi:hypothetical protein
LKVSPKKLGKYVVHPMRLVFTLRVNSTTWGRVRGGTHLRGRLECFSVGAAPSILLRHALELSLRLFRTMRRRSRTILRASGLHHGRAQHKGRSVAPGMGLREGASLRRAPCLQNACRLFISSQGIYSFLLFDSVRSSRALFSTSAQVGKHLRICHDYDVTKEFCAIELSSTPSRC